VWVSGEPGEHRASERCVVICPWHNFDFDVETGRSACEPDRMRIKSYPVRVECGEVAVYV
jgi:nitrite reductase/ring-hydroxylating ferredoxin subunit